MRNSTYKYFSALPGVCLLVVMTMVGCETASEQAVSLNKNLDTLSFYSGVFNAEMSKDFYYDFNQDAYLKGIEDVFETPDSTLTRESASYMIEELMMPLKIRKAQIDLKKGENFLSINKTHKGVVIGEQGLQYEVIKNSNGNSKNVDENSKIVVKIIGKTPDNDIFMNTPAGSSDTLQFKSLLIGLQKGIKLMKVGEQYRFYLPTEMAFRGTPPANSPIKPMMPLIFEVELLNIIP